MLKTFNSLLLVFVFNFCLFISLLVSSSALAFSNNVTGLEYELNRISNPPIDKAINKRFDLYELYFENQSAMVFSIPGYSIDLGLEYSDLSDVLSVLKKKKSKKLAVLNIATGAASIAFGGLVRSAANTAIRSVNSLRNKGFVLKEKKNVLSPTITYILYPGYGISIYFFVDKHLDTVPTSIKYLCKDEGSNINHVVVNHHFRFHDININEDYFKDNNSRALDKRDVNNDYVIANPESLEYE